mmetsp:Transcript_490/g.1240  ORF Transcript_490/g.1240 Transcript_490/m.1240 type:complete len:512 (+) Transcript_490:181-1716(+)
MTDEVTNRECKQVLKKTMNHAHAWPFNDPVDPVKLGIPDYFDRIKSPMDLGTVRSRVDAGTYSSVDEFVSDVRLTFNNAKTYNRPETDVYKMAQEVEVAFDKAWDDMLFKKKQALEAKLAEPPPQPPPPAEAAAPPPAATLGGDDDVEVIPQLTNRIMGQLLKSVKNTEEATHVFNMPVDPEKHGVPDYFAVIIHPMDLGTVESRLDKGMYSDTAEFVKDVRLVWSNAKTYNPPGTPVHNWAAKLEDIFERELRKACNGPGANKGAPAVLSRQPTFSGGPKISTAIAQQVAPPEPAETPELVTKACKPVISSLRSHQHAKTFNAPVDLKKYPMYLDHIPRPMDLKTVLKKLDKLEYTTIADCHADVDLIWNNAIAFNGAESWVARNANTLKSLADHKFDEVRYRVATGNIQSPRPTFGVKRKAPSMPSVVSSNEFCCLTPEMRNQLTTNASKLDGSQLRSLLTVVQQCCPTAVRSTSAESWDIDPDMLDITSFVKVDTWVRRLIVNKPAAC